MTVILVTSCGCWLEVGNNFWMLVKTYMKLMWVDVIDQNGKHFKVLPTHSITNICHQHLCNGYIVTTSRCHQNHRGRIIRPEFLAKLSVLIKIWAFWTFSETICFYTGIVQKVNVMWSYHVFNLRIKTLNEPFGIIVVESLNLVITTEWLSNT